ncbi:MAG: hypothetical protein GMKNLPBB_00405 [Myxococcota bacterium]|nr:hypothetical protein [Myxococcota bacterium]
MVQAAGQQLRARERFTVKHDNAKLLYLEWGPGESTVLSVSQFPPHRSRIKCFCSGFHNSGVCAHAWAALRLASDREYGELLDHLDIESRNNGNMDDPAPARDTLSAANDDGEAETPASRRWRRRPAAKKPGAPREPSAAKSRESPAKADNGPAPAAHWEDIIDPLPSIFSSRRPPSGLANNEERTVFVLDLASTRRDGQLTIALARQRRKLDGEWGQPRFASIRGETDLMDFPEGERSIIRLLYNANLNRAFYGDYSRHFRLTPDLVMLVLPMLASSDRLVLAEHAEDLREPLRLLRWDGDETWEYRIRMRPEEESGEYVLEQGMARGEAFIHARDIALAVDGGLFVHDGQLRMFNPHGAFPLYVHFRSEPEVRVPRQDAQRLLSRLYSLPALPPLDLPEELKIRFAEDPPRPCLTIESPRQDRFGGHPATRLTARLSFEYGHVQVDPDHAGQRLFDEQDACWRVRDFAYEDRCASLLYELGLRRHTPEFTWRANRENPPGYELSTKDLPRVVSGLLREGWKIHAQGKAFRPPGKPRLWINSGVDWFDLKGGVDYGGQVVPITSIIEAMKRGQNTVTLGDGSMGLLPGEWLRRAGLLLELGEAEGEGLRFKRSQTALLDALLAAETDIAPDEVYLKAREELRGFEGVQPVEPPPGFQGELRAYQREGLGWIYFLRRFGLGGCLADDMGLGKTVQVLALLEGLRCEPRGKKNGPPRPSLVVVPKSLIFNWIEEARRFTPQLRVLNHTGKDRPDNAGAMAAYDVVLTTYGTLRRDIEWMREIEFAYAILDEAQTIKNAGSASAKAARLIRSQRRLALSGTPIENHLGELWSLMDFLNPGMLGSSTVFNAGIGSGAAEDPGSRALLAQGLRPYILRRTKQQVARELPEKSEQVLYCELEEEQRAFYNKLKEHYRHTLLGKIDSEGLERNKIFVLEALLRLRQAACHPGLVEPRRAKESSAKLDLAIDQIQEVIEEGHKVLLFSQFVTFLSIIRQRFDQEKTVYEYLDGKTRDRKARVDRFQNDPECKLFLISLKAGGLGLNLTAAEYVYLMDPWWNPAVEAQAIDRAHRIGQTRTVFAYSVIAKDTVEEKVLELQRTKKNLADAIITGDNSVLKNIGREEIELLLS